MKQINLERLQDLVLARVSVAKNEPLTAGDVTDALYPLLSRRLTRAEWSERFASARAALEQAGWVEPGRLLITAAGRARLKAALGLESPPAAKSWREFKARYLPRLACASLPGVAEGAARASAAVLAQRLGVTPKPKGRSKPQAEVARVVDTWLAASLGLPAQSKLTFDALRGALLARELGLAPRPLAQVTGVAIATLSGATSGSDAAVGGALTLRWLFDELGPMDAGATATGATASSTGVTAATGVTAPASPAVEATPGPAPRASDGGAPIERIAAKALAAAEGPEARQFGPNKVFIGSVWRALAGDPEIAALGEAAFKRQLAEAHRRGLLELGRADLVAAMDPGEVTASEIVHHNATYHFILRGASA